MENIYLRRHLVKRLIKPFTLFNKVFITGGTGFLGAYLIQELVQKKYTVRALRRSNKLPFFIPKNIFDAVEWIEGDLFDVMALEEAMEGVDAVIHAAGKVSFRPEERKEMFRTNIEGTANVVNTAIAKDISRLVHVSSIAALGRTGNGEHVDETKQWKGHKGNTHYAISKYHGEIEAWRAFGEGLNGVIVNPSTVLGYGDWNCTSCAIFKNVYEEFPWYTSGINGFVDVEDAARAIVLLMETNIKMERFILSGATASFRELFYMIADGFAKKRPGREATAFLAEIAWRLEKIKSWMTGNPSILTRESAMLALTKTYFENSKMLQVLPGFSYTPLETTISKTCQAYLSSLPG